MDALETGFDLVVIGAGINGLGIARDATLRGLRVVLLEKEDLCSGTSAWSGRLVHGGLRYLEHRDFALVRESLRERERLFRLAPHLVVPRRLMVPFFRHNRRPPWMIRLGMLAYDVLSFDKSVPGRRIVDRDGALARFPGINRDGLNGGAVFTDGQVELAERLCVELAVAAVESGAVVRTRARVDAPIVERGRVVGVTFTDAETGEQRQVRAPMTLNVAGPWIDDLLRGRPGGQRLNGGTKGSHLVVGPFPGAPSDDVVYYESKADGRLVLVIPWLGRYLIGTTDIRFDGDPDDARCDTDEMAYLLGEVNALVPDAHLRPEDVLYTYSGVRPLPYEPGVPESSVTRKHVLHEHGDGLTGLVTVVGGKLTTYRQLAEDAVDLVFERLGRTSPQCVTGELPFPGMTADPERLRRDLERQGIPAASVDHLVRTYGRRATEVVAPAAAPEDADLLEPLGPGSPVLRAEVCFAVEHEMASSLTDVFARRLMLAFEPGHGLNLVEAALDVLGPRLGWDGERRAQEAAGYRRWLDRLAVPPLQLGTDVALAVTGT